MLVLLTRHPTHNLEVYIIYLLDGELRQCI